MIEKLWGFVVCSYPQQPIEEAHQSWEEEALFQDLKTEHFVTE